MAKRPQKKRLIDDEDELDGSFMSSQELCCRFLFGSIALIALGAACGFLGYYFGYMTAKPDVPPPTDQYMLGVGRSDITGPIVEVNMMGYALPSQIAEGLHQRLYARSYIVSDMNLTSRVVFVTADCGMGSQIIKLEVVKKLKEIYGDSMYTEKNVVISGTHTHSGPAGFFQTLLPEVTSLGAIQETTDAFVDGIVDSIGKAHNGMQAGTIQFGNYSVVEGNINRSPSAYLYDDIDEREKYNHNTEHEITMMKLSSIAGEPLGMVTWYPVHGTAMNNTNHLISSDNKGRASALFERKMRKPGENITGEEEFVGAFAAANLGDVSPNTQGPMCVNTGLACDFEMSTCPDGPMGSPRVKNCYAQGPGVDMFDSTDIIAKRQLEAANLIYDNIDKSGTKVNGSVGWVHQYLDMSKAPVQLADGSSTTTCEPGMGYSFAAGTTDGPGAFNFVQSDTRGGVFWDTVRDEIIVPVVCTDAPPRSYYACHRPKPVLLPTGYMDKPYEWHPKIVDIQMLKIGQFIIAAVPGEFTTMSGRRFKDNIAQSARDAGVPDPKVVIAGLSNVYTHYITTPEEYKAQRYEGASTIYGPNTFTAYLQHFTALVSAMVRGEQDKVDPGPAPENILDQNVEFLPPPSPDTVPEGKNFGDVMNDTAQNYTAGSTASVTFYGANPRHNQKLGATFLEVQRYFNNEWTTKYVDTDWETKFHWEREPLEEEEQPVNDTATVTATDSTATTATGEHNVLTNMFKMISNTLGVELDVEEAMKLHDNQELSLPGGFYEQFGDQLGSDADSPKLEVETDYLKNSDVQNDEVSDPLPVESHVTVEWDIPRDVDAGKYRIVYHGDAKVGDKITPFSGTSSSFTVYR